MNRYITKHARKATAAVCTAAILLGTPVLAANADDTVKTSDALEVTGNGTVTAVPDQASVTISIQTDGKSVTDTENENKEKTDAVLAALKNLNVEDDNIKTSGYQLYPQYSYDDNGTADLNGYRVETSLTISAQSVDIIGKLLSAAFDAGANSASDISYTCSNYDDLYKEALKDAVSDAANKAQALAEASGRNLDRISDIREGYQDTTFQPQAKYSSGYTEAVTADMASSAVSVMPGIAEIDASVSVTYVLADPQ